MPQAENIGKWTDPSGGRTFTHLDITFFCSANIEINDRISHASSTFGRLSVNVWEKKGLGLDIKLKV